MSSVDYNDVSCHSILTQYQGIACRVMWQGFLGSGRCVPRDKGCDSCYRAHACRISCYAYN